MYIAMNRFLVTPENEPAFEQMWLNRDTKLNTLPGFIEFHMLKGPAENGLRLYASHTLWESERHFHGWVRSDEFRTAHARAEAAPKLSDGAPKFEGFSVIQHLAGADLAGA